MIIVGAKGFAKELLEVCHQLGRTDELVFFDNVSTDLPEKLFSQFPILRSEQEVKAHFEKGDSTFALGLGHPILRKQVTELFESWGGELTSLISPKANIGNFGIEIGEGNCVMTGTVITNDVILGEGNLINLNVTIGHDVQIGDYCEICPGVHISGNVTLGDQCFIGTGAVLLPGVKLGERVIVGAGSVVTRNIADGQTVKGIPAR